MSSLLTQKLPFSLLLRGWGWCLQPQIIGYNLSSMLSLVTLALEHHLTVLPHLLSTFVIDYVRPWFCLPVGVWSAPCNQTVALTAAQSCVYVTARFIACHASSCPSACHSSRIRALLGFLQLPYGLSCRNQFHMINFNIFDFFLCTSYQNK